MQNKEPKTLIMNTVSKYFKIKIIKMALLATVVVSINFFDNYKIACLALIFYVFVTEEIL